MMVFIFYQNYCDTSSTRLSFTVITICLFKLASHTECSLVKTVSVKESLAEWYCAVPVSGCSSKVHLKLLTISNIECSSMTIHWKQYKILSCLTNFREKSRHLLRRLSESVSNPGYCLAWPRRNPEEEEIKTDT